MGVETIHDGTVSFMPPVDPATVPREYAALQGFGDMIDLLHVGGRLAGITDGDDPWAKSRWTEVRALLEDIARRSGSTMTSDMTWACDTGSPADQGQLLIDQGGRFHLAHHGDDPQQHHTRTCGCYSAADADRIFGGSTRTDCRDVTIADHQAGPFTEHRIHCLLHGAVDQTPTLAEAVFQRERHLNAYDHPAPGSAERLSTLTAERWMAALGLTFSHPEAAQQYFSPHDADPSGTVPVHTHITPRTLRRVEDLAEQQHSSTPEILARLVEQALDPSGT